MYAPAKIEKANELLDIVNRNKHTHIIGEGWIAKLLKCFVEKYAHLKLNYTGGGYNAFIIAQQEGQGRELAKYYQDLHSAKVFYLSNDVKNEMDTKLMKDYPDIYEKEVLFARKSELDESMHLKFSEQIKDMMRISEFPIFQEIEIETINRCNGTCSFCPINRIDDTRQFAKMEDRLFESIILQLVQMDYRGRVGLYSNNEPLLDKRIINFARMTQEKLPNACKIVYTNGTLLNKDIFVELIQYLDILCIDLYYDNSVDDVFTDKIVEILEYGFTNIYLQEKVMIQVISRKAIRNNRGGQSKNRKNTYKVKSTCMLPFIQMIVRPDGKLSMCCNDALGKNTLGDLNEESLTEAWNNINYQKIREQIRQGRQNMNFCKYCDNYASVNIKGNEEFSKAEMKESWDKIGIMLREKHGQIGEDYGGKDCG